MSPYDPENVKSAVHILLHAPDEALFETREEVLALVFKLRTVLKLPVDHCMEALKCIAKQRKNIEELKDTDIANDVFDSILQKEVDIRFEHVYAVQLNNAPSCIRALLAYRSLGIEYENYLRVQGLCSRVEELAADICKAKSKGTGSISEFLRNKGLNTPSRHKVIQSSVRILLLEKKFGCAGVSVLTSFILTKLQKLPFEALPDLAILILRDRTGLRELAESFSELVSESQRKYEGIINHKIQRTTIKPPMSCQKQRNRVTKRTRDTRQSLQEIKSAALRPANYTYHSTQDGDLNRSKNDHAPTWCSTSQGNGHITHSTNHDIRAQLNGSSELPRPTDSMNGSGNEPTIPEPDDLAVFSELSQYSTITANRHSYKTFSPVETATQEYMPLSVQVELAPEREISSMWNSLSIPSRDNFISPAPVQLTTCTFEPMKFGWNVEQPHTMDMLFEPRSFGQFHGIFDNTADAFSSTSFVMAGAGQSEQQK